MNIQNKKQTIIYGIATLVGAGLIIKGLTEKQADVKNKYFIGGLAVFSISTLSWYGNYKLNKGWKMGWFTKTLETASKK